MKRAGWRNRGISAVAAVCYGLTVTTAGLLHNHRDFDAGNGFGCCCSAQACVCAERPDQPGLQSHESSSERCPADGSQCTICKFLAQKTLPVAAVVEVSSAPFVQFVAVAATPQSLPAIAPSWHSRAPPDAA